MNATPRQEALVRALVACGYFANVSEAARAAIEAYVAGLPTATRHRLALLLHGEGTLDAIGVAELLGTSIEEARVIVGKASARHPRMTLAQFRRALAAHAVQERLLHMAAYRCAVPAAGLRRGASLAGAARSTRRGGRSP